MNKVTSQAPKLDLLIAVFLISGALLITETLFVRLVSILLYPVATYLVISLALLGFGVGGTFLASRSLKPQLLARWACRLCLAFSVAICVALFAVWTTRQTLTPLLIVALGLPFVFGGASLALTFSVSSELISRVYFADLLGAGLGAAVTLFAMPVLGGVKLGLLVACIGLVAAGLFLHSERKGASGLLAISGIILAVGSIFLSIPNGITPISPKELSRFLDLGPTVAWEHQGWSALARIDVVSLPNDQVQLPGVFNYKLVTQDGGAPSILLQMPDIAHADFTEHTVFGIPYWIKSKPNVLIIGLGGGPDVQAAIHSDATAITGVEVNPQMIEIVKTTFADFVGHPYADPRVQIIEADGRHIVQGSSARYDIIQLTGVDSSVASLGGNPNLVENYLYTVNSFTDFFQHLTPDGVLSVSFPAVDGLGLRLVATAATMLKQQGITNPEQHVIVSLTGGFVHVLVKHSIFTPDEIATVEKHFDAPMYGLYFPLYDRLFTGHTTGFYSVNDVEFAPNLNKANVYLSYWAAVQAGTDSTFLNAQPQNVIPPTDDWPFFFVLDRLGGAAPNITALLLTLGLLAVAALIFILIPAMRNRRRAFGKISTTVYFAALGLGFIFVEVVMIQKLSLFLGHPSYALTLTLSVLLISSGLGSLASTRTKILETGSGHGMRRLRLINFGVSAIVLFFALGLTPLLSQLLFLPTYARFVIAVIVIAVPGFLMGMPFPIGLGLVKNRIALAVPWVWSINSAATVIGTIGAVLLAMSFGFTSVLFSAALLYIVAGTIGTNL